jgi:hypothetical protein
MDYFEEDFNNQFKLLSKKYRGLRREDLEKMNPSYSCVICQKFKECGRIGRSCESAKRASEEEFSSNYKFS